MPTRQTTLPGTQGCPALSQDILHLSRSRHPTRNHFRAEVLAIFTRNHTAKPTLFRFPSSFISNLADQELPNAIGVTTSSQVCDRVREREREREKREREESLRESSYLVDGVRSGVLLVQHPRDQVASKAALLVELRGEAATEGAQEGRSGEQS